MLRALTFAAACIASFGCGATASDKPVMKVVYESKTRSLDITIEADERIANDARLYRSIVEHSKSDGSNRRKQADSGYRKEPILFRNGPWAFERGYYFEAEAGPYISVSIIDYVYSGGAHPNHFTRTILWNREHGRRTSVAEIFRESRTNGPTLSAVARLIREDVAREKRERGIEVEADLEKDPSISSVKADLKTMGAPSLVPSTVAGKAAGLSFHFSHYDVGAYAEGAYTAYLPWQQLEPFLTDKAHAWFGGDRAETDDKKD